MNHYVLNLHFLSLKMAQRHLIFRTIAPMHFKIILYSNHVVVAISLSMQKKTRLKRLSVIDRDRSRLQTIQSFKNPLSITELRSTNWELSGLMLVSVFRSWHVPRAETQHPQVSMSRLTLWRHKTITSPDEIVVSRTATLRESRSKIGRTLRVNVLLYVIYILTTVCVCLSVCPVHQTFVHYQWNLKIVMYWLR